MKCRIGLLAGSLLALSACTPSPPESSQFKPAQHVAKEIAGTAAERSQALNELFEHYNDEFLELNPINAVFQGRYEFNDRFGDLLSEEHLTRSQELEKRYLDAVKAFPPDQLSNKDRISYDIFVYDRELALRGLNNGSTQTLTLLPINQMTSWAQYFPLLGSGQVLQPFNTVEDYENWIKRAEDFQRYIAIAISKMRQGITAGVTLPRVLAEKTLPQFQQHIVEDPQQSTFFQPIDNLPEDFSKEEKERLTQAYLLLIRETIVPTYQSLANFFEQEYIPAARKSHGIGAVEGGLKAYQHTVQLMTGTTLTAEEIHQIGIDEANRLYAEMEKVKIKVGFDGDMQAFFRFLRTDPRFFYDDAKDLIQGYEDLRNKINPRLSRYFNIQPKADYVIKEIEAFRAPNTATAMYFPPSVDGTKPGVFYVNTFDLKARPKWMMEALSIHEASPGHHFQIAINREAGELPSFRQFAQYSAYTEGWGLYSETFGLEMGMYEDPYQYFGMLYLQIWRANRLVVDTGLHHKGWTREQAIEFMQSNSPITETDVITEVERYMAMPGQALAYMIGRIKMLELRTKAEQELGDKFDLADFHYQILADGGMPLAILEKKIDRWIAEHSQ